MAGGFTWHASTPPSGKPAQSIPGRKAAPCMLGEEQRSGGISGTCASCRKLAYSSAPASRECSPQTPPTSAPRLARGPDLVITSLPRSKPVRERAAGTPHFLGRKTEAGGGRGEWAGRAALLWKPSRALGSVLVSLAARRPVGTKRKCDPVPLIRLGAPNSESQDLRGTAAVKRTLHVLTTHQVSASCPS